MPVGEASTVAASVTEWDDHRGWGVVRTDAGVDLAFHCTAITDGTRTTSVGTAVRVVGGPGHHGRWEAVRVEPAGFAEDRADDDEPRGV